MGTYSQFNKLVYKLRMHGGSFKEITDEIQRLLEGLEKGKPEYFECGKYRLPIGEKTYVMEYSMLHRILSPTVENILILTVR